MADSAGIMFPFFQLQLLDRSPVQTPVCSTVNSPSSTPRLGCSRATNIPLPVGLKLLLTPNQTSPNAEPAYIPITTLDDDESLSSTPTATTARGRRAKSNTFAKRMSVMDWVDLQDRDETTITDPMLVCHLDRSPVQSAFQTRASSPSGRYRIQCHGISEAAETVRVLNTLVESSCGSPPDSTSVFSDEKTFDSAQAPSQSKPRERKLTIRQAKRR